MIFFVLGDMIMTTVLFPISFVVWVPFGMISNVIH